MNLSLRRYQQVSRLCIILKMECYTYSQELCVTFDTFYRASPDRESTGTILFAPIFRIAFVPSSSAVSFAPDISVSSSSFFSHLALCLLLSSLFFLACLRSTKMRSCPPTTPSRRTACVDLVAGDPLAYHLLFLSLSFSFFFSLSQVRKEGKTKVARGMVSCPLWGGCNRDVLGGGFVFLTGFLVVTLVK